MRTAKLISFTILFIAILFFLSTFAEAGSKKYQYNLYWSGIKAGTATLEYVDTPDGLAIKTHAVSSKFLSMLYKVDDRAETVLYSDGYPKSTTMNIHEGRHRKHKVTNFSEHSEYSPQTIAFHDILKDEKEEYELDKPAYDPLSGYYAITQMQLEIGRTEYIKMFDNKKIFNAEIHVLKKENIQVPAGKFDTIMLNPVLQTEGLFVRKGKMYIWLTDDERKIPVMFRSKVKIGSFIAKLAEEH